MPDNQPVCPTIISDSKAGNKNKDNENGEKDDKPPSDGGSVRKKLLAILFALSLGLVSFGFGLLGYPIITILYGFVLICISIWGYTTKQGKLFTFRFFGEKEITYDYSRNSTYGDKPYSKVPHKTDDGNVQSIIKNNEPTKKKDQYSNTKDNKPKTLHNTPPRGK